MACALGIEQDCNECRMCGNGKGGKKMFVVNGDMFGRYVKIPHVLAEKGEKFVFKVVGRLQSNAYYNVPIGGINSEYKIRGAEMVDVLRVIQCGVDETEVLTVALKDCEFVEPRTNADRIRNMTNEELASFLDEAANSGYNCWGVLDSFSDFDDGCCSTLKWLNHEVSNNFEEWLESECDAD